ncbi:MAG: GAF domain-containing sensor histidine kinase [Solirubrobacterales bacterium]
MPDRTLTGPQLVRLLEVGRTLVSESDLESVLERVLFAAKDLTGARYAALGILDKDKVSLERFLNLGIDEETRLGIGPLPQGHGVLGELIRNPRPLRLDSVADHPHSFGFPPGHPPMDSFLGVPIKIRNEAFGNIYLTEKRGNPHFDERDEAMLVVLADWAAVAIDNARGHQRDSLRMAIAASEQERRRWAMELHDETLQDLGALKVMQEGALTRGDPDTMKRTLESAAAQLDATIAGLEGLIQELRPATLDALGIAAAIETLADRMSTWSGIGISTHVDLGYERGDTSTRLDPQLEATIYRVVQESLHNTNKHAEASKAAVSIVEADEQITIFVEDDGKGFSASDGTGDRFGLHGMRERVDLAGGTMVIDSAPGKGARVEIHLPVSQGSEDGPA